MAQFQNAFDATQVEPNKPMDVIPDGDYLVIIEHSEWKKTKAGTGTYLELSLQIVDGPQKGRKLWDRLNLDNPNQQAVDIAQQTLSAICHATGVMRVSDSAQLHNLPLLAKVKVKQGENGPMNEIKGYRKGEVVVVGSVPSAAPKTVAAAPASPPWKKAS